MRIGLHCTRKLNYTVSVVLDVHDLLQNTLKIGLWQSKTQEEVTRQRHCKRFVPGPPDYICATIMLINMGVGGRARSVRCGFSQTNFKWRPERSGRVFQSSKSCVNSSAKVMSFGKFPARI